MNKLTKFIALLLIVFMLPVFAADETPVDPPATDQSQTESEGTDTPTEPTEPTEPSLPDEPVSKTAQDYADEIISYYSSNPELSSWWDVVALYGVGENLENYTLPEWTTESLNKNSSVTDYAGIIFGLIATGENVHDIWDRDIADELAKMQDPETGLFGDYPNQQIYSILALDAAKEPYDRDSAISILIDTFRADNGAFGYLPWGPSAEPVISPDIDLTAMALLVLDSESHSEIITSAVDFLAESQLENGGFASFGTENSNTLEAAIWGLSSHNLLDDERFIKNDHTLTDVLGEYILENGMLTYESGSDEPNLMATQQGLIALSDIISGKNVFLRLNSEEVCTTKTANVRIEGSSSNILDTSVTVKCYEPNILDAIKTALDSNEIPYVIEGSEYGAYIQSINGETEGKFGGWDGWLVAVNGESMSSSADAQQLSENDEILVYYGMFAPGTLIPEYTLSTDTFKEDQSFTVTVTGTYFDYDSSENVTVPIAGATVEIGGKSFTTDSEGIATIYPPSSGTNTIKIYKNNENSYPSIVRIKPFTIEASPSYSGGGGGSAYVPPKKDNTDKKEEPTETPEIPSEDETPEILKLTDMSEVSGWATVGVEKAVSMGLFQGDENECFNPKNTLTRAELALLILRFSKTEEKTPEKESPFTDINPEEWYYSAVCNAFDSGFMSGFDTNTFAPGGTVTREQFAVVMARALNLKATETSSFSDENEISDWAKSSVAALVESKIMVGSGKAFNPKDVLTREMCAVVMISALEFAAAQ